MYAIAVLFLMIVMCYVASVAASHIKRAADNHVGKKAKPYVHDGREIYNPAEVNEVESLSDVELTNDVRRAVANMDSNLPTKGIVKNWKVTNARLVRD